MLGNNSIKRNISEKNNGWDEITMKNIIRFFSLSLIRIKIGNECYTEEGEKKKDSLCKE